MEFLLIAVVTIISALTLNGDAKKLFNPASGICCSAKVIPFAKEKVHRGMSCCKQSVYDWKTEICCEDKIMKLPPDESVAPPGSSLALLAALQSASIRKPFFGSPYSCCGSGATTSIYDHEKEHCCEGKVHKMPQEAPDTLFPTTFACCGSTLYNTSSHDCCLGGAAGASGSSRQLLRKSIPDEYCCHDKLIDFGKFVCCMNNYSDVKERPGIFKIDRPDISCCGANKFYYDRAICCDGRVIPLPKNLEDRMNVQCCGNRLFDGRDPTKICCQGQLLGKKAPQQTCCNNQLYDLREKICCDGRLHQLDNTGTQECCGRHAYNNQSTCCRKTLTVLPLNDDNIDASVCCD